MMGFEDYIAYKGDEIDNAAYNLAVALLRTDPKQSAFQILEWNMELIAPIIEAAKDVLQEHGKKVCWPYYEDDYVYDRLTADNAFRTLVEMKRFCHAHRACSVSKDNQDEYNFYLEGENCLFWIRCITRPKNYNLYLHAYTKEQKGETL